MMQTEYKTFPAEIRGNGLTAGRSDLSWGDFLPQVSQAHCFLQRLAGVRMSEAVRAVPISGDDAKSLNGNGLSLLTCKDTSAVYP